MKIVRLADAAAVTPYVCISGSGGDITRVRLERSGVWWLV
jgi:hypothetical protein